MTQSNFDETRATQETTERVSYDVTAEAPKTEDQTANGAKRNWRPVVIAIALGAAVLGWEYRETLYPLLSSPLLFLLVCVGMHFLMHRGHGKH